MGTDKAVSKCSIFIKTEPLNVFQSMNKYMNSMRVDFNTRYNPALKKKKNFVVKTDLIIS